MTVESAFVEMDRLIREYRASSPSSNVPELCVLAPLLSRYGAFFTDLPLEKAFRWYNKRHRLAKRRHVGPSDDELRQVFNVAQLMAMSRDVPLRLASFDGDETLYDNRQKLESDSPIVEELLRLMDRGVVVSLTTAVGGRNPEMFEERLEGLLNALATAAANEPPESEIEEEEEEEDDEFSPPSEADMPDLHASSPPVPLDPFRGDLFVVGGQCNFLFRLSRGKGEGDDVRLVSVPDAEWKTEEMLAWDETASTDMLKYAESALRDVSATFRLPIRVVNKEAAVGALYCGGDDDDPSVQLYLDELALEVRERLNRKNFPVPFNCFNGGLDVFVDVGSKQHGLSALQGLLRVPPESTIHFGDQFTMTGNDLLARRVSPTCWIQGPKDTHRHLRWLRELSSRWRHRRQAAA